jgi:hypothetical protein
VAGQPHRIANLADPILFSDLRDIEAAERDVLVGRQNALTTAKSKRSLTAAEDGELVEIAQKLVTDDIVDPLFKAVQKEFKAANVADVADHKGGLFPTQQILDFLHEWYEPPQTGRQRRPNVDGAKRIVGLANLENAANYQKLAESIADLWNVNHKTVETALTDVAAAFDAYVAASPYPDDAAKAAALQQLKDAIDIALVDVQKRLFFADELKTLVDAGQIAGAEALVDWLMSGFTLTARQRTIKTTDLTAEEKKLAAVIGLLEADSVQPPTYHLPNARPAYNPSDFVRKQQFGKAVFGALGEYNTNIGLFLQVLPILVQLGNQGPFDTISAKEWAMVVRYLLDHGITEDEPQLGRRVNDALNSIQNIGDNLPPSDTGINLPDVDGPTQILKDNILALQPAYFASMFEEMRAFQVVDKLVELFQNGVLPITRGKVGNALFKYWKETAIRVSENERRSFYSRTLGSVGGDSDSPNREFNDLFMRFVSSVSWFVRQNNVDDLLRSKIPSAISQQQVRKAGRDLAANLSLHGYGMAYFMATDLQKQVTDVINILSDQEIKNSYGARDMWQVIDQVAATELGGAKDSLRYRTMAAAGAIVIAWLANRAERLSAGTFEPILNIDEINNPPPRPNGAKATTQPNDSDLFNACEQWLAVTGTQEDMVEDYSQRKETPNMPSKPIQIPAIAKEMLESAGIPGAMGLGSNGYASRRHSRV